MINKQIEIIRTNKINICIGVFIFLLIYLFAYSYKNNEKEYMINSEINKLYNYQAMIPEIYDDYYNRYDLVDIQRVQNTFDYLNYLIESSTKYLYDEDYKNYNLSMAKINLVFAVGIQEVYKERDEYVIDGINYFEKQSISNELSKEIGLKSDDYSVFIFDPIGSLPEVTMYPGLVMAAEVYYENYLNKVPPLSYRSIDSISLIYQTMLVIFPTFLFLLISIICMEMINADRKSGVLKLMLIQPKKRMYYILYVFKRYFKKIMAIVFIPLIIVSLIFSFSDHFDNYNSKILAYECGINTLNSLDNNIDKVESIYGENREIYFFNTRISPADPGDRYPQNALSLIPFWKLILLAFIESMILIVFYLIYNLLFHIIFDNTILASSITIGTGLFLMLMSPMNKALDWLSIINPFNYRNPIYSTTGFLGYSYLMSLMILLIFSFLIFIISNLIFKHKEIN